MNFYYKISQLDGRIENHHLNVEDENIYLDLLNDIRKGVSSVETITEYEFLINSNPDTFKVDIHQDLHKYGDAEGGYLGYLEHYAV